MARPTRVLIDALLATAERIQHGANYRWTHMGACNCGHLAQTLTQLSPAEIHRRALQRAGDWSEQARDYCATSQLLIDEVIELMLGVGLTRQDIHDLERLSGQAVLHSLPVPERVFDRRSRADVVRYMRVWAALLRAEHVRARARVRRACSRRARVRTGRLRPLVSGERTFRWRAPQGTSRVGAPTGRRERPHR